MKLINVREFRAHVSEYQEPVTVIRYSAIIGTWLPHNESGDPPERDGAAAGINPGGLQSGGPGVDGAGGVRDLGQAPKSARSRVSRVAVK